MKPIAIIAVAALTGLCLAGPGSAQPASTGVQPEVLVQKPRLRPRTRLHVRPLYPNRHFHTIYPLPYSVEYPGPNAHRECVDAYVTERRPSGTVVTSRMRCRWVAGRYPGP